MPLQSAIAYKADQEYKPSPCAQTRPGTKYPFKWTFIGLGAFCAGFWLVATALVSALT